MRIVKKIAVTPIRLDLEAQSFQSSLQQLDTVNLKKKKKKNQVYVRYQEEIRHHVGGKALEVSFERSCGLSTPVSIQSQVEWALNNLLQWKVTLIMELNDL